MGRSLPLPFGYAVILLVCLSSASILLAVVSYKLFESRFLRLKVNFRPVFVDTKELSVR